MFLSKTFYINSENTSSQHESLRELKQNIVWECCVVSCTIYNFKGMCRIMGMWCKIPRYPNFIWECSVVRHWQLYGYVAYNGNVVYNPTIQNYGNVGIIGIWRNSAVQNFSVHALQCIWFLIIMKTWRKICVEIFFFVQDCFYDKIES